MRSRQGGRVLSALKLPLFLVRPPYGYAVLETTGRRTGRRRRKCVRAIVSGPNVYLTAIAGQNAAWVRNLTADPNVRLRIGTRWRAGTAAPLTDAASLARARVAYVETVVPFDRATCWVHRGGRATQARVIELTAAWFDHGTPVEVRLR